MQLQPNYIVDSHNHKIAVQLDIKTYEKTTETLENYALYQTFSVLPGPHKLRALIPY
jgi:hypothetical protein